ncbi:energy transducer TonB [Sphingomonas sp.]|uniref:energy transducer TonB n=1 Tax=Sphingomonas sp. TaxID=28214 RepID=UPI00286D4A92|nr:energy transducer TonB [Sphingomonas sp.]
MLAYAAHGRRVAERHSAPHVMMLIVTAHIAVIAAVMSARMELPPRFFPPLIKIRNIKVPPPPPPILAEGRIKTKATTTIDHARTIVPPPQPTGDKIIVDTSRPPIGGGETIGTQDPTLTLVPVRVGPRFATPPSEVRPPYPPSKLDREEEAVLRLKLTIDANGRVVAVDAVGKADPAFLAAARRHLMAHWRYRPATEDGRAMVSATVITLRFELNE